MARGFPGQHPAGSGVGSVRPAMVATYVVAVPGPH